MKLIELGPPGAGKGTQSELLHLRFGIPAISSGDELRKAQANDPEIKALLATGRLLPFEMVLNLIMSKIDACEDGFTLDGVPRDLFQAEYMDRLFAERGIVIDHVLHLYLPEELALERLRLRAEKSGRSDDVESTFAIRFDEYRRKTEPVVEHYDQQGLVVHIDASLSVEEVFEQIPKPRS